MPNVKKCCLAQMSKKPTEHTRRFTCKKNGYSELDVVAPICDFEEGGGRGGNSLAADPDPVTK